MVRSSAQQALAKGKKVLVIDKRPHIAGNVHRGCRGYPCTQIWCAYLPHEQQEVWDYIYEVLEFNRFTNSPVAITKGELYSLPFNMYTFNKMWGGNARRGSGKDRRAEKGSWYHGS